MTTKPKAKKYRIRRSASLAGPLNKPADDAKNAGDDDQGEVPFATSDDGFGDEPYPTARKAEADYDPKVIAEIEAIKAEGATGRQLRLARRVAQKRGLSAVSDYDAVRLLREHGIDPFKRSTMLSLVVPEGDDLNADVRTVNLPAAKKYDEATRAQEVYAYSARHRAQAASANGDDVRQVGHICGPADDCRGYLFLQCRDTAVCDQVGISDPAGRQSGRRRSERAVFGHRICDQPGFDHRTELSAVARCDAAP